MEGISESSDFISDVFLERLIADGYDLVPLRESSTRISQSYVVKQGDRLYFMKRLKEQWAGDSRYRELFRKEYEVGSKIHSPYVVRYERLVEDETGIGILMEYVAGSTVSEQVKDSPEFFKEGKHMTRFLDELLAGLRALHDSHVLHLDLKSENVMITQVGGQVKILDLGFCFADAYMTTVGYTHKYAAPEQNMHDASLLDERTDIHAVGLLLQYIRCNARVALPLHMRRIAGHCTKIQKSERFQSVAEIQRFISRTQWLKRVVTVAALLGLLILGYDYIGNTEMGHSLQARYRYTTRSIDENVIKRGDYFFRVTDDKRHSAECLGGMNREDNAILPGYIWLNDRNYQLLSIGNGAYKGAHHLRSVYIPEGYRTIGVDCFEYCESLVNVDLPRSVTTLGASAFRHCSRLKVILLSPMLKEIPMGCFVDCKSLHRIDIPEGVERICIDAFGRCTSLREVNLPSTLHTLERGVFWECSALEEIHLPSSLVTMGEYLFYRCHSLKHVYNHSLTPQTISSIFDRKDIILHVPAESVEAYRKTFPWNQLEIRGDLADY